MPAYVFTKLYISMCVSGVADRATHICLNVCAESLQSCLTLCDTVDCSPPGYSVHGILQAGILKRLAISFSIKDMELP